MQPVTALRARRRLLALTPILTIALATTGGAVGPAAAARPEARLADACGSRAALAVSERGPRQLRPVRFSAVGANVPADAVVFYDFNYGDGSDDASAQPTAVHAYREAGTYLATVSIVTTCNTIVSSAVSRVVVLDGEPPTVSIGYPRANQVVHFGRAGLLLSGSARDPSGVRRVELAIQLLNVKPRAARSAGAARTPAAAGVAAAPPAAAGCFWYDGRVTLKARACATPIYFAARVEGGRWSFRLNPRSQIPAGVYIARVRATDRRGNRTAVFSPQLGNILAFALVA